MEGEAKKAKWAVLVSNGYRYEYEGEVEAATAYEARKIWARRGDWMTVDFKVRKEVQ